MEWLQQFMGVYRHLFHPLPVLVGSALVLAVYEWHRDDAPLDSLVRRIGSLVLISGLVLVPVALFILFSAAPARQLLLGNTWKVDLFVALPILLASVAIWMLWQRHDWGWAMQGAVVTIALTSIPYAAISLGWNISGHVTFTVVPTLYLALVDRRFRPLLLIPALMVPNRPFVGMHTWAQSLAGVALGVSGVVLTRVLYRRRADRTGDPLAS